MVLIAGCGANSYLVVSVDSTRPLEASALEVILEGAGGRGAATLSRAVTLPPPLTFAVDLGSHGQERLTLTVRALSPAGELARGGASVDLAASGTTYATVVLGEDAAFDMSPVDSPPVDIATSDLLPAMPDMVMPDMVMPDMVMPDMVMPDMVMPDMVMPDMAPKTLAFQTQSTPAGSGSWRATALADIDTDGRLDAVLTHNTDGVKWMKGNGDGTFVSVLAEIAPGTTFGGVAVADLDGNGRPDVVAGREIPGELLIALASGTAGSFTLKPVVAVTSAYGVAIGDLDNDGQPDIVAGSTGVSTSAVSWLRNIGSGTFAAPATQATGVGINPSHLLAIDLNRDGRADVVTACVGSSGDGTRPSGVYYLIANTSPGLNAAQQSTNGADARNAAAGNLDADSYPDLVAASSAGNVAVYRSNAGTSFSSATTFSSGTVTSPEHLILADMDGDGNLDIVLAAQGRISPPAPGGIAILRGRGDATFQPAQIFDSGTSYSFVAAGHFNADLQLDLLVIGSAGVQVLIAN
jgi:hypothetical protein